MNTGTKEASSRAAGGAKRGNKVDSVFGSNEISVCVVRGIPSGSWRTSGQSPCFSDVAISTVHPNIDSLG